MVCFFCFFFHSTFLFPQVTPLFFQIVEKGDSVGYIPLQHATGVTAVEAKNKRGEPIEKHFGHFFL